MTTPSRAVAAIAVVAVIVAMRGIQLTGVAGLVLPGDMQHLGSFKVPNLPGNGFNYGGTALAYHPANDSLFLVGHTHDQRTAEIKIPAIGGTATILQPLADSLAGRRRQVGQGDSRIGGNLVYKDRLYVSSFLYYDAASAQKRSHYSRPLTLKGGTVTGPLSAGSMGAGFYSGYMTSIPDEWQARLGGPALTGNCCLSIISRTSFGPAAFAFDPEHIGQSKPLLFYTSDHQTLGTYGAKGSNPMFNGSTRIQGVVFPPGTASLLFFGVTGVGPYCYGSGVACKDPVNPYQGEHAYPYRAYVWAYNAADLADVAAGTKKPWDVTPYDVWELRALGDVDPAGGVGGAAYDPVTRRIFVSELNADGTLPLIHVFQVTTATSTALPRAPGNVRIVP